MRKYPPLKRKDYSRAFVPALKNSDFVSFMAAFDDVVTDLKSMLLYVKMKHDNKKLSKHVLEKTRRLTLIAGKMGFEFRARTVQMKKDGLNV
jgi:hypothetical protein